MQYKIFEINKVKLSAHNRKALLGCPPLFPTRHEKTECIIWWNLNFPSQQNQIYNHECLYLAGFHRRWVKGVEKITQYQVTTNNCRTSQINIKQMHFKKEINCYLVTSTREMTGWQTCSSSLHHRCIRHTWRTATLKPFTIYQDFLPSILHQSSHGT